VLRKFPTHLRSVESHGQSTSYSLTDLEADVKHYFGVVWQLEKSVHNFPVEETRKLFPLASVGRSEARKNGGPNLLHNFPCVALSVAHLAPEAAQITPNGGTGLYRKLLICYEA
jgi:hypothetical protein